MKRTEGHTGVPYQPVQRTEGHDNFGYVDLKREPGKLDSIPELQDSPELKEFLRELNHPRSLFRSVGCEKSMGPCLDPIYKFKRTSFVTVVFEILEWNHEENFQRLFQEFDGAMRDAKNIIPEFVMIEFEIHNVTFNAHAFKGFGATIWVDGFGRDEEEAMHHWRIGIAPIQEYFRQSRSMFQRELDKGRKTVS